MVAFTRIVLAMLSGPGIASPNADLYELTRDALSDAEAQPVDAMLAASRFTELGNFAPVTGMRDGPHKSHITVDWSDGQSHAVDFLAAAPPRELQDLIAYVKTHGKSW